VVSLIPAKASFGPGKGNPLYLLAWYEVSIGIKSRQVHCIMYNFLFFVKKKE